jgi:hypothetical protein
MTGGHTESPKAVALALLATVALALIVPIVSALPREGNPVAIIGSPAASSRLVAAIGVAGGTVLAAPSSSVTLASPGDPSFVSRLRQQGYWLVVDAQAAAACGDFLSALGGSVVQYP